MTFQNVMQQLLQEEKHDTFLLELTNEGTRYHNSRYIVVIERQRTVEELLQKTYPGNTFFAYFTNEYHEKERSLDVIFHIRDVKYLLSFDVHMIQKGRIDLYCGTYKDGDRKFDEGFEMTIRTFPNIDQYLLKFLETHPSYRLYFTTNEVELDYYY